MLGTIINTAAIVVGALLGKFLGKGLRQDIKNTILQGLGLGVLLVGLSMAFETRKIMIVLVSLLVGAALGEWIGIEKILDRWGKALEMQVSKSGSSGSIAKGFVTASLIFCVGAMAVMGALESGLKGTYDILLAKSLLDGVMAIVLASTMGIGVAFSAASVFVYQGSITVLAQWVSQFMSDPVIAEMTSVGGLLIVGIGLNILEIASIRVGNLLPAIFVAFALSVGLQMAGFL